MHLIKKMVSLAPILLLIACGKGSEEQVIPQDPFFYISFYTPIASNNRSTTAVDITELTDGSLFALGGADQAVLGASLTATGDTIWTRRYGLGSSLNMANCYGTNVIPTPDGQVMIAGFTNVGQRQSVVEKLDHTTGAVLWHFAVPSKTTFHTYGLAVTKDGGAMLLTPGAQENTFAVRRISPTGTELSAVTYPCFTATEIRPTADGNFIIVGTAVPLPTQPAQLFLKKVTPEGTELWHQNTGETGFGLRNSIVQTPDGGYAVLSGFLDPQADDQMVRLFKADASGQKVFSRSVIKDSRGYINRVELGSDNGLAFAGVATRGTGANSTYLPMIGELASTGDDKATSHASSPPGFASSVCRTSKGLFVYCLTLQAGNNNYQLQVQGTSINYR
jgi:hypothetical protein